MASPASKIVQKSVSKVRRADRANSILRGQGRPPLMDWVFTTSAIVGLWSAELSLSLVLAFADVGTGPGIMFVRLLLSALLVGCISVWAHRVVLYVLFSVQPLLLIFLYGDYSFLDAKGVLFFGFFFAVKFYFAKIRKPDSVSAKVKHFTGAALLLSLLICTYYVGTLVEQSFLHSVFPFLK